MHSASYPGYHVCTENRICNSACYNTVKHQSIELFKNLIITSIFLLALTAARLPVQAQLLNTNLVEFNGQPFWISGSNVAWVNFARDLGPGSANLTEFELAFSDMRINGGNTMRLWLHTTGASTPAWNGTTVTGPGTSAITNLQNILDLAEQYDVALLLCLWSFDMMRISNGTTVTNRSRAILTQQENRQTYIDNALIPMVEAVKGHKAILAWEIFNEAEGMSEEFGWDFNYHVPMADIQAFVNQAAGAIRRTDPGAQVTTGTHTFHQISDVYTPQNPLYMNYYRDDRLVAAGGDEDGTLDFYTVHFYGDDSPFTREASWFGVDKPLAIGEFFAGAGYDGVPKEMLFKRLYDNGYAGALTWQWVDWRQNREGNQATWLNTLPNMRYMYSRHRDVAELTFAEKPLSYTFTAGETAIEAGYSTTLHWTSRDAESVMLNGEAVFVMDDITVTPAESTDYILTLTHSDGSTAADTLTVHVIPGIEINRASDAPMFTDAGNTWTYFDLNRSYGIVKSIVPFTSRPAGGYAIQGSYDGHTWTTWTEVPHSDSSADTLHFEEVMDASFIRILADNPFELNEIGAFGLLSDIQPPKITITSPSDGTIIETGKVLIAADIIRGSGNFPGVWFHINGQEYFKRFAPYEFEFEVDEPGEYILSVEVRETNFPNFFSRPVTFSVPEILSARRYEAESAIRTGSLTTASNPEASGGQYVVMEGDGILTWSDVQVSKDGVYPMRIGYYLPFDHKTQYLNVNGERADTVLFPLPVTTWQYVEREVSLQGGSNSISIEHFWGWMWFDYIEILGDDGHVSIEQPYEVPLAHSLGVNYPNPFNPVTTIPYTLARPVSVHIEVFDILGRRVASADRGLQTAGSHTYSFNASGLSSGVYIYRLRAGEEMFTRRMMLLK